MKNVPIKLVIIFYGIGDLVTTYLALSIGKIEINPVAVILLKYGFMPLIISKVIVIYLLYRFYKSKDWFISKNIPPKVVVGCIYYVMLIAITFGLFITMNNFMVYLTGNGILELLIK